MIRILSLIFVILVQSCIAQTPSFQKPNRQIYEVTGNEKPLKIRVTAVLLQRDDGSGNYSRSRPEEFKLFQTYWNNALNNFQNLKQPPDLEGCYDGFDFWPSAMIEFEDTIIEVKDSYAWNNQNRSSESEKNHLKGFSPNENWYLKALDDSLSAAETHPSIHVYFTNDGNTYDEVLESKGGIFNDKGIAAGQYPSQGNLTRSSQIHMPGVYPKYIYMKNQAPIEFGKTWEKDIQYWYLVDDAKGLTHELGHNFGLGHANEYHGANQCRWTIMSQKHTHARNYLQPTEIQKMHRNFSNTNLIQFITPDSHYGKTIRLMENTVWDQERRYYHDFELNRNIELVISNRITLPNQAKIVLNRNSKLIFKGNGGIFYPDGREFDHYEIKRNARIIRQ